MYPYMFVSQALLLLIHNRHHNMLLSVISEDLVKTKIPVILFQILIRLLQRQSRETGSWGRNGSREETAYAILALANLASLKFVRQIRSQIDIAISRGRHYLLSQSTTGIPKLGVADYIWSSKVPYATEHVYLSYIHSALSVAVPFYPHTDDLTALLPSIPTESIEKFAQFYSQLRMFKGVKIWQIKAYLIEGYLFILDLIKVRSQIFDRKGLKEDSYFEYIPFSWTASNNMSELYFSAQTIFDMMANILISFQIDEFFDICVQEHGVHSLAHIRSWIESNFDAVNHTVDIHLPEETVGRLSKFVHFVLHHPRISNATENDRMQLLKELRFFLVAHIQQCEDNARLQSQKSSTIFNSAQSSFFRWVRTTGSDHYSAPYAFAFIACLLGSNGNNNGTDFFPTPETRYIAQDCIAHLSIIGRIYNDYGSLQRDRKEMNVNSIFFPEFVGIETSTDLQKKKQLKNISEYEQQAFQQAFNELCKVINEHSDKVKRRQICDAVRLFYHVNEIYTEVYELKDISTSK